MKKHVAALAFIACALPPASTAWAVFIDEVPQYENKEHRCRFVGIAFDNAAFYRDLGHSPEMALERLRIYAKPGKFGISVAQLKSYINAVFFDPAFAQAGGMPLSLQIKEACMRDWAPKFQPLR